MGLRNARPTKRSASCWALEPDVAFLNDKKYPQVVHFYNFLDNEKADWKCSFSICFFCTLYGRVTV
ncbi:hypothetical protein D8M04_08910 [Oceanobacillus piezotolerans]|uniref:Uncharacterized protein n=1 Tax=Oceanobacillus piezotolerans TaxID=2448030 RepID=A0A498DDC6_9BACI|nr:hypothetical protein D8M04_08910 [Oceanobacillus piezotolerans]